MTPNLFTGMLGSIEIDERFVMHRYISSRIALIVGCLVMAIWFNYVFFAHDVIRWDLLIFLCVMALTKMVVMLYYRLTG